MDIYVIYILSLRRCHHLHHLCNDIILKKHKSIALWFIAIALRLRFMKMRLLCLTVVLLFICLMSISN